MKSPQHAIYMQHCIDQAATALADVAPNPMVGSCLVCDGEVIALGIHRRYGEAHAEVNAITSLADREALSRSTLYITLEPCNHFGKTPPCTELIISSGIRRVIVATTDPNPKVAGSGIAALRAQGITVEEDVLRDEARFLNRRFFTFHQKKRPYIILKWAHTADGFVAREDYSSKWISSENSRALVHRWRGEEQAILVGTRTALHDDPQLTTRGTGGKNPLRVVIDNRNSLPATLKLWQSEASTLCFVTRTRPPHGSEEVIVLDIERDIFPQILEELWRKNILSLIVEGGSETLSRIIAANLWDEARVFESQTHFGTGIAAPILASPDQNIHLLNTTLSQVSGDSLRIIYNKNLSSLFNPQP